MESQLDKEGNTVSKDGGMRSLEWEVRQSKRVVVGIGQVHTGCGGIPQHLTVWLATACPQVAKDTQVLKEDSN